MSAMREKQKKPVQGDILGGEKAAEETAVPETVIEGKAEEGSFPVAGIGASAGGLEAFGQFFSKTPPDSGMAFVLNSTPGPSPRQPHAGAAQTLYRHAGPRGR